MGRQLQLNFTPLLVRGDAIQLQTLPFKDSQQLRGLRDQYRTQYAVINAAIRQDRIESRPCRSAKFFQLMNDIGLSPSDADSVRRTVLSVR
jgi:hypothetical protein